ncbi:hypothetical protein, partial [uncultured Parabacteroides sp.]|uniref:hypothetical protein n=1 Tax=uncultured Parabacteroides sp. TaxID=512312 RepID=UPI0025874A56
IWNAVRFVFKYSILRELRFITLSAILSSGNQKEYFSERPRHLIFSVVNQKGRNHEKSQSKMDQNFGRNRKMPEKGGYCLFPVCKGTVFDAIKQ